MTFPPLDPVLQHGIRFTIMILLDRVDGTAPFVDIARAAGLKNSGSLSVHGRVLEEAGLIKFSKSFRGRRPLTTLAMTARGKRALTKHLETLAQMSAPETAAPPEAA